MIPRLNASFYASFSGNEPVREWLKTLSKDDRRTIGEDIAYVQYKWSIGKPRVDHLRGAIWEARSTLKQNIARTLFAVDRNKMTLLHAFIKKTQETHASEIAVAEVHAKVLKRALAEQLQDSMTAANISKVKMAKMMSTSRTQLDRVLDPDNVSVQLDTLMKAASAVGKTVEIKIRSVKKASHAEQ